MSKCTLNIYILQDSLLYDTSVGFLSAYVYLEFLKGAVNEYPIKRCCATK